MTADASADLLALAKSMPSEKLKIRALRGYLRLARQLNLPPERRMAMYREALALATRGEEKRLAVDVLQRIPTSDSLALAVGHFRDPAVSEAACVVIVAIARQAGADGAGRGRRGPGTGRADDEEQGSGRESQGARWAPQSGSGASQLIWRPKHQPPMSCGLLVVFRLRVGAFPYLCQYQPEAQARARDDAG